MKRLIAFLVAPLFVTAALAQTPPATGSASDNDNQGQTFGSDWSAELGAAIFADDARTTLRSDAELKAQWGTLSTADQDMIRRDCAVLRNESGGTFGAMPGTGTVDSTGTVTPGISLDTTQMEALCAAVETM